MKKQKAEIIVALDVDSLAEVRTIVDQLSDLVSIFKVGSHIFTACGPAVVRYLEAHGKKVFLDLKYHDIPNTVANAVKSAVDLGQAIERTIELKVKGNIQFPGLFMYTLHTVGGPEMLKAAVEAGTQQAEKNGVRKPLGIGVTVLTSEKKQNNILDLVLERAIIAKEAGLDGVVASVYEAKAVREELGKDFIIVSPGIRPEGSDAGDQQRIATPKEAIISGSNYLVVGRPIVKAKDPRLATQAIIKEIS